MEKKSVKIPMKDGKITTFTPFYEKSKDEDVFCNVVSVKIDGKEYFFNYLDLQLFCYMVGNEEQRMKLANFQLRKVREIPYDVEFKLTTAEKISGIAKRRISLSVDEALLHVKKNEKFKEMVNGQIADLSKKAKV